MSIDNTKDKVRYAPMRELPQGTLEYEKWWDGQI